MTIPFGALDTLFLDSGNTLVSMDDCERAPDVATVARAIVAARGA